MDQDQMYAVMLDDIANDRTEQARSILSNLIAMKMASKLQQANQAIASHNATLMVSDTTPTSDNPQ